MTPVADSAERLCSGSRRFTANALTQIKTMATVLKTIKVYLDRRDKKEITVKKE